MNLALGQSTARYSVFQKVVHHDFTIDLGIVRKLLSYSSIPIRGSGNRRYRSSIAKEEAPLPGEHHSQFVYNQINLLLLLLKNFC